jgi:hypothetical protein
MARLAVVREQINRIEQTRLERLEKEPAEGSNTMVSLLAGVIGVETADLLAQEVLSRNLHGWKREREKTIFCRGGWMRLCEGSASATTP